MSLERNIGREDEFRVSGGSEFQSRGPMTEKALLPSDDRTYGMERTSESEDRVETECDGNERLPGSIHEDTVMDGHRQGKKANAYKYPSQDKQGK